METKFTAEKYVAYKLLLEVNETYRFAQICVFVEQFEDFCRYYNAYDEHWVTLYPSEIF